MKVLLLALNARYTHSNLALRYLRNEIAPYHDVILKEYSTNQNRVDILEDIIVQKPDVILFSVYIWNSRFIKFLIPDIKKVLADSIMILGGPEVSFNPQDWLNEFSAIDLVVCGAGEAAVKLLAENNFKKDPLQKINDSYVKGSIVSVKNSPFSKIPFPYIEEDFAQFTNHYTYYESSRGCPFSCAYCLSSREDQNLEYKSAETAISELNILIEHNPIIIKFVDRTFNSDPERARKIWRYLADIDTATKFHFEIHPLMLEDKDFELLQSVKAERFQFEIGVQSVNYKTLSEISRPVEWRAVCDKIARIIEIKNIHTHLDLIAGLPNETLEDIARSFDEILSLKPDHFQMGFLKALHGTTLRENAADYQLVFHDEAPYQIICNKWLSVKDIADLRKIEKLLDSVYNTSHITDLIDQFAKKYGGYFAGFKALSEYCDAAGFDCYTKNEAKVRKMLNEFISC